VVLVRLAGIGGQEFTAAVDLVAHRRDVVLVAAGAQEAQGVLASPVPGKDALDMPPQGILLTGTARAGLVASSGAAYRGHPGRTRPHSSADRVQHLLLDGQHRVRNVGINDLFVLRHTRSLSTCGLSAPAIADKGRLLAGESIVTLCRSNLPISNCSTSRPARNSRPQLSRNCVAARRRQSARQQSRVRLFGSGFRQGIRRGYSDCYRRNQAADSDL